MTAIEIKKSWDEMWKKVQKCVIATSHWENSDDSWFIFMKSHSVHEFAQVLKYQADHINHLVCLHQAMHDP